MNLIPVVASKRNSKIAKGQTEIVKWEDRQDHDQHNETKDKQSKELKLFEVMHYAFFKQYVQKFYHIFIPKLTGKQNPFLL